MTTTVLAADEGSAALLTLAIAGFAAVILICIGVGLDAARKGRRTLAITMAWVVGILTIIGVIVAILSSVH